MNKTLKFYHGHKLFYYTKRSVKSLLKRKRKKVVPLINSKKKTFYQIKWKNSCQNGVFKNLKFWADCNWKFCPRKARKDFSLNDQPTRLIYALY